jgi:hypothetical protein
LQKPEGSYQVKEWTFGSNLVTDLGDEYYAQRGVGGTVTNDFVYANGRIELRNQTDTPAKTDKLGEVLGVQAAVQANVYVSHNDVTACVIVSDCE